ncbi:MAG: 50S ribosomal protein L15 [Chlamydiae bacterium RIFCSPHIGHO2_12_FULL_44_59]|nr:MAG: 50S ribosomal protein L15 [Chlamydiae bacterium RIFCSPHIGHO2_01_FULL_44_39]OGN60542.1 MAG: 50S ribosomal protein L15 [Chlamydiae bacterium RIFCSPHIGHO2_12_FULL_44_59]OGN65997.1 MAG: 50S ribosomal protein L15 [Chlamydiae bacterium RIFCSPLOWO2_01_FULL_44_52]OGN68812.1 MAG: 50S ribosomal protein L15 [Chlamydiae bacterium RIFCSPLOWO2_02_FULL_45_22]OGN70452.1 MAG: 50S ribosomal protein L15 [Chlamydiae bacterium RIFCSPLOWO2_12_FULL_45_20]
MTSLSELTNVTRAPRKFRRVGRGTGCKRGKTSGRGEKGDGSRSGYRRRFGYEGGQVPLYRKLPIRGFTRGTFLKPTFSISLQTIEAFFEDGEVVNVETLRLKKLIPRRVPGGIKILADGTLTKKVSIEVHHFSKTAEEKLNDLGISFKKV